MTLMGCIRWQTSLLVWLIFFFFLREIEIGLIYFRRSQNVSGELSDNTVGISASKGKRDTGLLCKSIEKNGIISFNLSTVSLISEENFVFYYTFWEKCRWFGWVWHTLPLTFICFTMEYESKDFAVLHAKHLKVLKLFLITNLHCFIIF